MQEVLQKHAGKNVKVFVVWEKVLRTDSDAPSDGTLSRVQFPDTEQFWDPDRTVSKAMGESDERSIVWDCVYVYPPGTRWENGAMPPAHAYTGGPVLDVGDALDRALP